MNINLHYNGFFFTPCTEEDSDLTKKLRQGEVYKCEITRKRNYEFHKKYFSLIQTAWEYMNELQCNFFGNNKEVFRKTLEVTAGFYEPVYDLKEQRWQKAPRSIAFDKMSAEEFEQLYERVKDVIFKTILTNINVNDFLSNLNQY